MRYEVDLSDLKKEDWRVLIAAEHSAKVSKTLYCWIRFEDDVKPRTWFSVEVRGKGSYRFEYLCDAIDLYNEE